MWNALKKELEPLSDGSVGDYFKIVEKKTFILVWE